MTDFVRHSILVLAATMLLVETPQLAKSAEQTPAGPLAGMGIMVGEVTPHTALVQVRLTKTNKLLNGDVPGVAGIVEFVLSEAGASSDRLGVTQFAEAKANHDFIARAAFENLKPGTRYRCTTRIGADRLQNEKTTSRADCPV